METQKLTVTVEQAARILGISRNLAYQMANSGRLPILRFGKRILVSLPALEKMLQECDGREHAH